MQPPRRLNVAAAVVMCLLSASCSVSPNDLVGTWKFQVDSTTVSEDDKLSVAIAERIVADIRIELKRDRTATIAFLGSPQAGSWSLDGRKITIAWPGGGTPLVGTVVEGGNKILPEVEGEVLKQLKGAKVYLVKEVPTT